MNSYLRNLTLALIPLAMLAVPMQSRATSTDVVLNLEGNPTCSSLGDNSAVLEYRDSNPVGVKTAVLQTPSGTQTIVFEVVEPAGANAEMVKWDIVEVNGSTDVVGPDVYPINYVILKAQGGNNGARVFHFGTSETVPGAIGDTDEEGPGGRMAAVSFCYGLTQGFNPGPEPPTLADLPNCDDLAQTSTGLGDLFTTGIDCPDGGEQQLIINMALNDPNFGFDFDNDAVRACTCNVDLLACNPELAAVPKGTQDDQTPPAERSCMEYDVNFDTNGDGFPDGVNTQVPFSIQGVENPDSYICYTIGGTRYCYGHY